MSKRHAPAARSSSQSKQRTVPLTLLSPRPASALAGAPFGGRSGPAHALLVTDRPVLAEHVHGALDHGDIAVELAATSAAVVAALERELPHLVLLDLDVEELRGTRALDALGRMAGLPVIAFTGRRDLETTLAAFELGIDDLLTIPFAAEELHARCMAVLRRVYGPAAGFAPLVRAGELEIDPVAHRARVGRTELHLTPVELQLLHLLATNAGQVLTREEIQDHLWGAGYLAASNVIDRHVRNLRVKLHDDWRKPRFIATSPGQGYGLLLADAGVTRRPRATA